MVDFDGVIHRYSRGWDDGACYDDPVPGAFYALESIENAGYEVVIFSTRNAGDIAQWLHRWQYSGAGRVRITNVKEPAVAYIDDRAIHFTSWSQAIDDLMRRYPVSQR